MYLGKIVREFRAVVSLLPHSHAHGQHRFLEHLDIVTHPVTAWRFWKLVHADAPNGGWHLASATAPYVWMAPGAWDADPPCSDQGLTAMIGRSRGFHGFRSEFRAMCYAHHISEENARPTGRWYREKRRFVPGVYGSCELQGRVVEQERGYRAQGMVIRSLTLVVAERTDAEWVAQITEDLERRYACEVAEQKVRGRSPVSEAASHAAWRYFMPAARRRFFAPAQEATPAG